MNLRKHIVMPVNSAKGAGPKFNTLESKSGPLMALSIPGLNSRLDHEEGPVPGGGGMGSGSLKMTSGVLASKTIVAKDLSSTLLVDSTLSPSLVYSPKERMMYRGVSVRS